MRRHTAGLLTLTLTAALTLTGCSSEDADKEPTGKGTTIAVTIADGAVTPNGERIEVERGAPITFAITSDVEGEMHVHSTPEHSIAYGVGETEKTITLEQAKVVEVELHDPAMTVVQLEVR